MIYYLTLFSQRALGDAHSLLTAVSSLFDSFPRSELVLVETTLPPLLISTGFPAFIAKDVPFSFNFESSDLSDWDDEIPLALSFAKIGCENGVSLLIA